MCNKHQRPKRLSIQENLTQTLQVSVLRTFQDYISQFISVFIQHPKGYLMKSCFPIVLVTKTSHLIGMSNNAISNILVSECKLLLNNTDSYPTVLRIDHYFNDTCNFCFPIKKPSISLKNKPPK